MLLCTSESTVLVQSVKEIPPMTLRLILAAAPLGSDRLQEDSVLLVVASMKYLTMVSAAVSVDTTL